VGGDFNIVGNKRVVQVVEQTEAKKIFAPSKLFVRFTLPASGELPWKEPVAAETTNYRLLSELR